MKIRQTNCMKQQSRRSPSTKRQSDSPQVKPSRKIFRPRSPGQFPISLNSRQANRSPSSAPAQPASRRSSLRQNSAPRSRSIRIVEASDNIYRIERAKRNTPKFAVSWIALENRSNQSRLSVWCKRKAAQHRAADTVFALSSYFRVTSRASELLIVVEKSARFFVASIEAWWLP